MTRRPARSRSGITLTEILISILILGVGVISLATLFPLGLIRLRNAQRITRGMYLAESAAADLEATNIMAMPRFVGNTIVRSWYSTTPGGVYYPFLQDTPSAGADWLGVAGSTNGVYRGKGGADYSVADAAGNTLPFTYGQGLPVAYDPLWRSIVSVAGTSGLYPDPTGTLPEGRFGGGIGFVRADPNPGGASTLPSAHGLQRVTNIPSAFNPTVLQTFVSPEDFILQDPKGSYFYDTTTGVYADTGTGAKLQTPSPLVPAMTLGASGPTFDNDLRFTWFFTGQLANAADATFFEGDIVVCENRPFGLDAVGVGAQATGETVVEAVWGYTTNPDPTTLGSIVSGKATVGYPGLSARRTVLLRWPSTQPDPDVRVGGWIADVTYERSQAVVNTGRFPYLYPPQRCYWYRVGKRTEPVADPGFPSDPSGVTFRRMTVWVSTPLRAVTLMDFSTAEPYHVEAALVMPSVIQVYPTNVTTR